VMWPSDQGSRFMTPMTPLLWLSVVTLILRSRWRPRVSQSLILLIALSALTAAIYLVDDLKTAWRWKRHWPAAEAVSRVVPRHATIGVSDVAIPFALMCSFECDSPIKLIGDDLPVPATLEFLLAEAPAEAVPNFVPVLHVDGVTVLKRGSRLTSRSEQSAPAGE
jgi:hypothetical protein